MRRIYYILAVLLTAASASACSPLKETQDTKTYSILGDSYSTFDGYIPVGNAYWYHKNAIGSNDVTQAEQTWWYRFTKDSGYQLLRNESYSGSTICHTGYNGDDYSDKSFITRMSRITAAKPDLIIIFGGTNDSWANSPVGQLQFSSWSNKDLYSCLPACCYMLDYFAKSVPESEIVFIINSELKDDITLGIQDACRHYGTHCLLLQNIEKKEGHPSINGMAQINKQLLDLLESLKH